MLSQLNRIMAAPPRLRDGGLTVTLLILAAGLEGTLKVWPLADWTTALYILAGAALGILAAWLGLLAGATASPRNVHNYQ